MQASDSSSLRLWFRLGIAASLIAGVGYWLVIRGSMLGRIPGAAYSMVVLTCIPGILAGSLMMGTVHSGFGDNAVGVVLTAAFSGFFWGTVLLAALLAIRTLRKVHGRSAPER